MKKKTLIIVSCIAIILIISIFLANKTFSKYNFTREFDFEIVSADCKVDILKGKYYINNINHSIPVVLSNNNNYEIKGNVLFNNEVLEEFTLDIKEKNKIINISFDEDTYNNLNSDEIYYIVINFTDPYTNTYSELVSFQKQEMTISIDNIETYINDVLVEDNGIENNEDTIIINNNLDAINSKITYKINFINNDKNSVYKIKNINEILNSNTSSKYESKIMNEEGILENLDVSEGIEIEDYLELYIIYNYDSSVKDNSHKTIINYEFKIEYTNFLSKEGLITASGYDNSTADYFGEFLRSDISTFNNFKYCKTYEECYGTKPLQYDEGGALELANDTAVGILAVDQSMGIDDAYSLYVTIKADTTQGNSSDPFARTILAISDNENAYLSWLGIYKNHLHLYSFHSGNSYSGIATDCNRTNFTSLYIGDYNNQIFNIQVSALRSGTTKIYINGNLIREFKSGTSKISYSKVVLGDLRIGRKLRFVGTIYDLAIYNKEITEEAVKVNWEYARDNWNITEVS